NQRSRLHKAWQRVRGPKHASYESALEAWGRLDAQLRPGFIPCVTTNWDDTPRYGRRGNVLTGSTPALFARHMQRVVDRLDEVDDPHRLLFLKSWNEWAEGNYVEPDRIHGRGYLDAIRTTLGLDEVRSER